MGDDDKGKATVGRNGFEERFEGLDTAGRSPNPDNGKMGSHALFYRLFLFF
jgi:hypothetical protein